MSVIDQIVTQALQQKADPQLQAELGSLWTTARQAPNDHAAMVDLVERLTASGRRPLATEIVRHLVAARQDLPWPLMMQATLESAAGRHEAALAIGTTLKQRFPAFERAAHVIASALIKLRRYDEAEHVLAEAEARNAEAPWLLADRAGLAEARGDWAALLPAATRWRELAPDKPQPSTALITALIGLKLFDEAETVVREALASFGANSAVRRVSASLAEARGDIGSAFARWAELCDAQPDNKAGYAGMLALARRTRRLDQMGDRLKQALERFPRDREILTQAAHIAGFADWQEADRLWQILESLYPGDPDIALHVATAMIGVRRERRKHLVEVRRRLDLVHARFPDFVPAYVAHLEAFRLAGSLDEAAEHAAQWTARFPNDIKLALARLAVAEERGAYADAIAQIEALRAREQPTAELEATYVRVLSRAGRHEDAEAACVARLASYPDDRDLLSEYARLASRRADWPEAVARWVEAQRRRPGDWKITEELRLLRQQLAGEDVVEQTADLGHAPPEDVDPHSLATIFSRFESLGGTTLGCEFGMVQSQFGSRNVSLLRWTKSDIDILIEAIEREFDGVGEEQHTMLTTVRVSADREEYVTSDKRFDMASNTFINIADAPADKMFQQTCRRMRFLRGKLIEDLNAAEKIFVFKVAHPTTDEKLGSLFRALRRYGPVKLLCVLQADAAHPTGSVRCLEEGLLVGYVTYFLESAEGSARGIEFETWKKLTVQAQAMLDDSRPVAAAAQ